VVGLVLPVRVPPGWVAPVVAGADVPAGPFGPAGSAPSVAFNASTTARAPPAISTAPAPASAAILRRDPPGGGPAGYEPG
jgi:hypothetical protein